MAVETNVERMRRLIEVGLGQGDLGVVAELIAPDCIEHQRGNRPGRDGVAEVAGTLHRWFTDFSLTVDDAVASDDLVWTRNRARGLNTGPVLGHPPTGKAVEVDVIDICRFRDGLVVEHWGIADQLGLLLQVGAMPPRR
jgi:predicted ester cyclase